MKKAIIVCCFIINVIDFLACDICGCSARENALGILPQIQKNTIGVSYQYRSFISNHLPDATNDDNLAASSYEHFHTVMLNGMYSPIPKLMITAQLPFNFYYQTQNNIKINSSGVGDLMLLVLGEVYSTKKCNENDNRHLLLAGIGTKMPTGSTNKKYGSAILEQNLQPGTGSFDFPFLLYYALKTRKSGIRSEWQYLLTTSNNKEYKFGNRFSGNVQTWYWYKKNNWNVIPYIGTQLDWAAKDHNKGISNDYSGGIMLNATIGADIFVKNFGWGLSIKTPYYQHIGLGYIDNKFKCSFQFIYLIQKNKKS